MKITIVNKLSELVELINNHIINVEGRSLTDEEKLNLLNRSEKELIDINLFLNTRDEPELGHLY